MALISANYQCNQIYPKDLINQFIIHLFTSHVYVILKPKKRENRHIISYFIHRSFLNEIIKNVYTNIMGHIENTSALAFKNIYEY